MKLSAPTSFAFIIAVCLVALAIISTLTAIPFVSANAFWVSIAGFAVLALGNLLKGF